MNSTESTPVQALALRLASALPEWVAAIGPEAVIQDAELLQACETATFATTQKVFYILRPADVDQVVECVTIANQYVIPIYPVSRGRNWGLGSRVPASDAVVLDLGGLSHIAAHDQTFGSIRLGPGATFQDVHTFLKQRNSPWFLPTIGGPPDASVVANFLERGDGGGPQADRLANIASLEVVLPSGERIETGYGRLGTATKLNSLSSEPAGPALHGLFTQSTLGIVTEATLFLARKPKNLQVCLASVPQDGLSGFVDTLQSLALDLQASSSITIWNGHKIKARNRLAEIADDGWFCTIALYAASPLMAEAQRELVLDSLRDVSSRIDVFDENTSPNFEEMAGIFIGAPTEDNIASLYVSKPVIPTGALDPERDRCGALWLCPEVPLLGATVSRVVEQCEGTLRRFGYPPILGMTIGHGRTARLYVSIFYDRDKPGEDLRALECHNMLQTLLRTEGCLPFRLGIASTGSLDDAATCTLRFIAGLKDHVDRNGILAPRSS